MQVKDTYQIHSAYTGGKSVEVATKDQHSPCETRVDKATHVNTGDKTKFKLALLFFNKQGLIQYS